MSNVLCNRHHDGAYPAGLSQIMVVTARHCSACCWSRHQEQRQTCSDSDALLRHHPSRNRYNMLHCTKIMSMFTVCCSHTCIQCCVQWAMWLIECTPLFLCSVSYMLYILTTTADPCVLELASQSSTPLHTQVCTVYVSSTKQTIWKQ